MAYKTRGAMHKEQAFLVKRQLDASYLSRVVAGLPNLRPVTIASTIEIHKLQADRTVRRRLTDPSGSSCDGKYHPWSVWSVAEKAIAVRPRQDGQ
jgi:hypothetical protein